jgi:hypothetical protein
MKHTYAVPGIAAVVALILGFGIGYYAPHHANARGGNAMFGANGQRGAFTFSNAPGGRGMTGGSGLLSGTVAKEDSGSLTLNTRDGSSHVVLFTPETTVSKSVSGSMQDVSVGSDVIVSGTTNADGSLSAASIQLRPAGAPQGGAYGPMMQAQIQAN